MRRIAPPLALLVAVAVMAMSFAAAPLQAQEPPIESQCGGANPYFATSCYAQGWLPDEPAVVAFHDTPDNSGHVVLAYQRDVGSTYGVAYSPEENALYVGAYHKRGTAFGPGGPGMIYRIDVATKAVEQWLNVPNVGTEHHDSADQYWPDNAARNFAGVVSLGDLDLNQDSSELYAMNLFDRKIYRYRISDKALLGTIDIGSSNESWANQARPFGLKFHNGKLYHGVVNAAYASQDMADLQAYVYETNPDGSSVRLVNQFSLDYGRGDVVNNVPARWRPWKDGYNSVGGNAAVGAYPMPMLSDIEFADNNDMILGFRDRNGDMTFFNPGGRNPPGEGTGIPAGDILIARYNGDTWDTTPEPEFFAKDYGPDTGRPAHDETSFGGLARVRDANVVVTTGLAPLRISSGGGFWFDMGSGDNTAREEIYNFQSEVNFGKANGLGDVELLCAAEQATETPTVTETAVDTETPTSTAPPTGTSTTTPTPSNTPTLPAGVTPSPTVPTATSTPGPSATAGPSSTNVPGEKKQDTPSVPQAATELPKLPRTGGGSAATTGLWWLGLLAAALIAAGALWAQRRSTV